MQSSRRDPRDEAYRRLEQTRWDSARVGFKTLGVSGTIGAAFCGVLKFSDSLPSNVLWGTVIAVSVAALVAYFVAEVERLSHCRAALQRVLDAEVNFEDLLNEVRRERDRALEGKNAAEMRVLAQGELLKITDLLAQLLQRASSSGLEGPASNEVTASLIRSQFGRHEIRHDGD